MAGLRSLQVRRCTNWDSGRMDERLNRMSRNRFLLLVVAVVAVAVFVGCSGGKSRPMTVWAVTMVPLAETSEFQTKLETALKELCKDRPVQFVRKTAMGDYDRLKEILAQADRGEAGVVVAIGLDVAALAHKETSRVPVVFCGVPYPSIYKFMEARQSQAPFVGLNEEPPMSMYCDELQKIGQAWTNAGVILPQGYWGGEKETEDFKVAFTSKFAGTVHVISIDAKTCSQLMDVVGAYNLIAAREVSVYYAINDGNIAKYLGMLVKQCKNQKIPVIGGGEAVIELGGVLAVVPDQDETARQAAGMVRKLLAGENCSSEAVGKFKLLTNTNALAELRSEHGK
ncbi:MAG: hypothetical protein C0404_14505 [Verrucomicrobia bacterium]|nr:hypothetical protein [Verrucomicrobiota bacterium]